MANWYAPSKTLGETPWLSPEAVEYFGNILHTDMVVCEFGGGGSTVWLSERVAHVITYEPNPAWYEMLKKENLPRVELINAAFGLAYCDLLFIDGEPVERRADWLIIAQAIASEWIVLDNSNRPEYKRERAMLAEFATLENCVDANVGNTKHLVTEFWRMK
jgi:hypothetical protein